MSILRRVAATVALVLGTSMLALGWPANGGRTIAIGLWAIAMAAAAVTLIRGGDGQRRPLEAFAWIALAATILAFALAVVLPIGFYATGLSIGLFRRVFGADFEEHDGPEAFEGWTLVWLAAVIAMTVLTIVTRRLRDKGR